MAFGDNHLILALTVFVATLFLISLYRFVLHLARNLVTATRGGAAYQPTERLEAGRRGQVVQSLREPSFYTGGLDPSIIAAMPVYVYKHTDQQPDDNMNGTRSECAVCLSTFENEEIAMLLPNCKHMFHAQCINMWFSSHSTCPICRCGAEPRIVPEPKEKSVSWVPFTAIELDFYNPMSPISEGTSDGSAQTSLPTHLEDSWVESRDRSESGFHPDGVVEDLERRQ